MNKSKKLLVFLSAIVMLVAVMCFGVGAVSATCPYFPDGEHWWELENSRQATCENDGFATHYCSGCMEKKTETKPALGGTCNWTVDDQPSACQIDYICSICEGQKSEYIDDKHVWMETDCNGDVGTCSPDYWVVFCCKHCGQSKTVTGATTGHRWILDGDYFGTCGEYLYYYCDNYCGETKKEKNLNPTSHTIDGWEIKFPTCTEEGLMQYGCLNCSDVSYTEVIPATGHTYKNDWAEILAPSCTGQGVRIKVCNDCSFVNYETLDSLGHKDDDTNGACDVCSATLTGGSDDGAADGDKLPDSDDKNSDTENNNTENDDSGSQNDEESVKILDRLLMLIEKLTAFFESIFSFIK